MKAKRFTEEQIIAVLKEAEAGAKTKELCRRHGISEATFYNWKAKYAGMTVTEARRLKELEQENAKLKRLLAEAELDKAAKMVSPQAKRVTTASRILAVYRSRSPSTTAPNSMARCSINGPIAAACNCHSSGPANRTRMHI